jgi:predicted dienelactone hydrolase
VNAPIQQQRLARRVFKRLVIVAAFGALGLAALFASLWLEHRTRVTLPALTGTFAVGRATYDWADSAVPDTLAPVPGSTRELLVWIWYPSVAAPSVGVDHYVPAAVATEVENDRGVLLGTFLTRDLSHVQAHSIPNPDLSPEQQAYPVVIMRAGASSEVWNYSTLAEDLASHGYVVVGFDAPYRTSVVVFPDGRVMRRTPENNPELCEGQEQAQQSACVAKVLTAWTTDIAFVLDRLAALNTSDASGKFKGRLDMARVGVFGHSFGGATATQFCHDDSRCKAAVDLDGQPFGSVIREGLAQPFMFLMSDHSRETDPQSVQIMANMQAIYNRLPENRRLRVMIRGANHFLFSDDGALLKSHIVMRTLRALGVVAIDGRRQLAVTTYCLHSFFDAYLKGRGVSRLKLSSPLYPEIEVLD